MRALSSVLLITFGITTASCSYVPPLSEATGSIPIRDVVERVKCEIADAFTPKLSQTKYRWLLLWTAKIDLTLVADNTGSITPVGTYVEPLRTVSGVAQQFTFGASANVSSEAIRTESVSFSLSLIELRTWRRQMLANIRSHNLPDPCDPGLRPNIAGNLGLGEWADSVLMPVWFNDLQAGDHPAPGASKAAAKTVPGGSKTTAVALPPFETTTKALADAKKSAEAAKKSADDAESSAKKAKKSIDESLFREIEDREFLRVSRQIASVAEDQAKSARQYSDNAQELYKQVQLEAAKVTEGDTSSAAYQAASAARQLADAAAVQADDAAKQAVAASENANNVVVRVPDPPMDSISHSVQFIVNAGASIAPSWTLVRFRGPTGNLAGITAKQTHTLNIALGPRGDNGARYSQEAVRALNNLTLQQIRVTQ
jgi:hypothetical protein